VLTPPRPVSEPYGGTIMNLFQNLLERQKLNSPRARRGAPPGELNSSAAWPGSSGRTRWRSSRRSRTSAGLLRLLSARGLNFTDV
jgi:hypothetical protein